MPEGDEQLHKFNPLLFPIRAEKLTADQLEMLGTNLHPPLDKLANSIYEFLKTEFFRRRLMLGLKGFGKTFNTLLALHTRVRKEPDFLPLMYCFNQQTKEFGIHEALKIANKEQWQDRLQEYSYTETLEQKASLIVVDDIHYAMEYAAEHPLFLEQVISFLQRLISLRESQSHDNPEGRKKLLLISEEPLCFYGSLFKNAKFDIVLSQFGQLRRIGGGRDSFDVEAENNYEIPYFDLRGWMDYLDFYGAFSMDLEAQSIFYHLNPSPRSLLKLSRLFSNKSLTGDMLFEFAKRQLEPNTQELFEEAWRTRKQLDPDIKYLVKFRRRFPTYEASWIYALGTFPLLIMKLKRIVLRNDERSFNYIFAENPSKNKIFYIVRRAKREMGYEWLVSVCSRLIDVEKDYIGKAAAKWLIDAAQLPISPLMFEPKVYQKQKESLDNALSHNNYFLDHSSEILEHGFSQAFAFLKEVTSSSIIRSHRLMTLISDELEGREHKTQFSQ